MQYKIRPDTNQPSHTQACHTSTGRCRFIVASCPPNSPLMGYWSIKMCVHKRKTSTRFMFKRAETLDVGVDKGQKPKISKRIKLNQMLEKIKTRKKRLWQNVEHLPASNIWLNCTVAKKKKKGVNSLNEKPITEEKLLIHQLRFAVEQVEVGMVSLWVLILKQILPNS